MKPMIEIYWNPDVNLLIAFKIRKYEINFPMAYILNEELKVEPYLTRPKWMLRDLFGWQKIGEL